MRHLLFVLPLADQHNDCVMHALPSLRSETLGGLQGGGLFTAQHAAVLRVTVKCMPAQVPQHREDQGNVCQHGGRPVACR
jgi:hypothetical protein